MHKVMASVRKSPSNEGFHHLGIDGVLRSFNSKREVVDYNQLSPGEVDDVVRGYKGLIDNKKFAELEQKFRGVDGRKVTNEEDLLHLGPGVRPQTPQA
ncbi:hypothetical protein M438DRAFT_344953 [Aureobasidium pullulans EXF-150]|uniref:Uncharacterized protein n=1 Tax=Aureobasidium pullulans EXF-150 TaxID=1043002 RepID=A0A074XRT3_AURPU|nr:uncharacterized protein M438DRAFT_344953 [Aureobasidium pullulans EXF-150]KEQ84692.1 hypothetical protein M438DRAFT_344953 [Aureobasidium pullulans EXF-150]